MIEELETAPTKKLFEDVRKENIDIKLKELEIKYKKMEEAEKMLYSEGGFFNS